MPKKDRKAIYQLLFQDGVLVAKKDTHLPKHPQLAEVQNLHVIKALQGLKSRGYVKEQFCWKHYYWYLTNEGIEFLRDYLHLPPEIVPATLKRAAAQRPGELARPLAGVAGKPAAEGGPGDRAAYRKTEEKTAAAGAGTATIGFGESGI